MGRRFYGALVQFGCYQHRYESKGLWCSSIVWLLSTQTQVNMLKLRPYLAKSLTIMLLMVLEFYAWLFNYPSRLIKHLFGYVVVYHPKS